MIFPSGHGPETTTNNHVSIYFCWVLGASLIYTNTKIVGFCVKTAITLQWTYIPVWPRLHLRRKHVGKFCPNEFVIYPMQTRELAAWKGLCCPQRMQRPWWQTMATLCTGFGVLHVSIVGINVILKNHCQSSKTCEYFICQSTPLLPAWGRGSASFTEIVFGLQTTYYDILILSSLNPFTFIIELVVLFIYATLIILYTNLPSTAQICAI